MALGARAGSFAVFEWFLPKRALGLIRAHPRPASFRAVMLASAPIALSVIFFDYTRPRVRVHPYSHFGNVVCKISFLLDLKPCICPDLDPIFSGSGLLNDLAGGRGVESSKMGNSSTYVLTGKQKPHAWRAVTCLGGVAHTFPLFSPTPETFDVWGTSNFPWSHQPVPVVTYSMFVVRYTGTHHSPCQAVWGCRFHVQWVSRRLRNFAGARSGIRSIATSGSTQRQWTPIAARFKWSPCGVPS